MTDGFVYLMIHPAHPELVIVSSAKTDPDDPAKRADLAPFIVIFARQTVVEADVEHLIIRLLTHYGHAVASHPNYFSCTPTKAITLLMAACDQVAKQVVEQLGGDSPSAITRTSDHGSSVEAEALYEAACAAALGSGDTIEDHHEALRLFQQAAENGCHRAYDDMGELYSTSETVQSARRALEAWKDGTKHGSAGCWAQLAKHYETEGHADNAKKCWDRFFGLVGLMDSDGLTHVHRHVGKALDSHSPSFFDPSYVTAIRLHGDDLAAYLDGMVTMCEENHFTHGHASYTRARKHLRALVAK